ncbi:MAG: rhodanese-like domain-containing protein [Thermomicrobiales bacterium]
MIIDRIFTPSLAQVAYLIADEASGEVGVVDPRRDVAAYLDWAESRNLRITAIFETHVHADFVSGGPELAAATGATLYASRLGNQEVPHQPLDDGDEVRIGSLVVRALWTPGHTPEHLSYLLIDPARGDAPIAVFTGDALFVGDVGRPDLLGAERTDELMPQLFMTVSERFASLPDETIVYPGHTAGSSCGKKIGDAPDSTIGAERRANYAFRQPDVEAFARAVMTDMPLAPTYYPELKRVNRVGPAALSGLAVAGPLPVSEVAALQANGALVVDTRSPAAFGAGHIPGAVSVGWGPNFLTWMGWLAPYDREVVVIVDDPATVAEMQVELQRIGLDRLAGFLDGGMSAWIAAGQPVETVAQITVRELAAEQGGEDRSPVLDVRGADEFRAGHVAGAQNVFLGAIAQGADVPFALDEPFMVFCGTGYRSAVTSSLLQARGYTGLVNVVGGMAAWQEAELPVQS